ncbi:MAG: acyl carrier protein [Methylococcales bacterium]|nr:acyl carrier protein [Methylococcales bacterium]
MDMNEFAKDLLQQALHLESDITLFDNSTPLLGNLAELDSIGVVNVITLIEEQLGCTIEDDEINAEVFETLGSLVCFIQSKQCS